MKGKVSQINIMIFLMMSGIESSLHIYYFLGNNETYYVVNGCPANNQEGSFHPTTFKANVRCCSDFGTSCKTPGSCPRDITSYFDAMLKCSEIGMRLCTKEELHNRICCKGGGGCDDYEIWTSTKATGSFIFLTSYATGK